LLDLALLEVVDRVGDVALFENSLTFLKFKDSFADPDFGKIGLRVEFILGRLLQYATPIWTSAITVVHNTLGSPKNKRLK
jgi:hypothetical protein